MKKILFLFLTSIILYSCKCEHEEVGRNVISESNKDYWKKSVRTIDYINQNGNIVKFYFNGTKSILEQTDEAPEVCSYVTSEYGKEDFSFGTHTGNCFFFNDIFYITINKTQSSISESLYVDIVQENYENNLENIEIEGHIFNDVLVLKHQDIENSMLNKIIYSKTNGIEFILFEDGTWYKRVE